MKILRPGENQKLSVQAIYSDHSRRDVTWLTKFDSNDAAVASVDSDGLVKVLRAGETTVRASFMGLVSVVTIASPFSQGKVFPELQLQNNVIDVQVNKKLQVLGLEPSGPCDDGTFLRRACLDATGSLPKPETVREFLADSRPNKRERVIDELLGSAS